MPNINSILSDLNAGYEQITDLIPNKVFFVDDFDVAKNEYNQTYNSDPLGNQFYPLGNGKYIWVGIDGSGGNQARNIRRYNSDFTLDETFVGPTFESNNNGYVRGVVEQSNGKLVIVGHFNSANGDTYNKILRLNNDGSIDNSFNNAGSGFNDHVLVIKLLPSNELLVGGEFSTYNGASVSHIAKLDADGILDETFASNSSTPVNNKVYSIKLGPSGKIYVGGDISNYLVRLNSDGTADTAFDVGSGFNNRVSSIDIDSNGKIVVGGWFDQYKGSSCNTGVVRLETNGDLDTGFTLNANFTSPSEGGYVQCLAIQSDNKIIVGGWFNEYDSSRQGHIIRFNTNGTKDTSFDVGYGFGDTGSWNGQRIQNIIIQNNKILCVGSMRNYNGSPLYGFAKLTSTGDLETELLFKYTSFGINDGYDDMYDDGNYINTNLTQLFDDISGDNVNSFDSIPNTHSAAVDENVFEDQDQGDPLYDAPPMDGVVKNSDDYFGSGSSYFTNMYPGMYVLVAENINIEEFSITGDVGSDGSTQNESYSLVVSQGSYFSVFLKVNREGSGGESGNDPSVNHIIIVPGELSGLTQIINEDGDDYDDHCIRGLAGRKSLYYILVAREESNYLSQSDAESIALKFLEVIGAGCGSVTVELDLSPDNPETNPNYRFDGEGNLDTAIVVDPITGKRRSIQRTGYFETVDNCGNRRVVSANDGGTMTNVPTSWVEALGSIIKQNENISGGIKILINSNYVDYVENPEGDSSHEANNIIAYMDLIETPYETFTGINASSFSSGSKILIPELEENDLLPDMTNDAKFALESLISNGGTLVMFEPDSGDLIDFLNDIFGFSLSSNSATEPISLTVGGSSLFNDLSDNIPANNGISSLDATTLPEGSITVYEGSGTNESVVTMIPYNSGKIYVMGWDWYDAIPIGSQDDGWLAILRAILES